MDAQEKVNERNEGRKVNNQQMHNKKSEGKLVELY